MPKARYKNKWHNIADIEKCEDGFQYQLEGIDGKVYHKDVDDVKMSKEEMVEVKNPDGSITRVPGKEPLMKPMKKSLQDRWALIKAMISHEQAFMPMEDEQDDQQQDDQATQSQIQDPDAEDKSDAVDVDSLKEQQGDLVQGGSGDDGQQLQSDAVQDGSSVAQDSGGAEVDQGSSSDPIGEEELVGLLKQEGYSDAEIAHIVHGHVPTVDHEAKQMDLEQAREQEKHDHKMDHQKSDSDIKLEHAKRMADLEHDHAKREKEIRLKYLEEELKAKLENLKSKGKE